MGVAPLGCAPRVMWEGTRALDSGRGCVEEANELIQGYNARLAARLDVLRPQLPGATVVFCDVYKGMMEILSNPRRYEPRARNATSPPWALDKSKEKKAADDEKPWKVSSRNGGKNNMT
ncbi:GDSL esterase/lipase [Panicum miliaceum]|uniref:GDSL esterase/lipase n=1 Tax=Panicum miliaceum TaxID=4540 RepID=A0A3L6RC48_PANMI|nr:GDSL esterase/lipase [Panicum miliaceum]